MKFVKPKREAGSHKGQNGKVLVVGGSQKYTGAVELAAMAAMRSGVDNVTVCAPEKVAWAINAYSPDLITVKLKGKNLEEKHFAEIKKLSAKFDVLLFGNGAGIDSSTKKLMKKLAKLEIPKVIDADGIKALGARDVKNAILTPNKRELQIFLKNSKIPPTEDPLVIRNKLKELLEGNQLLLLNKGQTDIIITSKNILKDKGGNPGLAKGGTGDVLAGLCTGYLAQLKNQEQAAINASIMNKKIGSLLFKKHKGYTYLASDMLDEIRRKL